MPEIPNATPTLTPHLVCAGAAEAIEFYKAAFGAEELIRMPGEDGKLMHAAVAIDGAMVMLVDEATTQTQTLTFGNGVDTYVQQARPTSSYGTATVLKIDGDAGLAVQTLLAFTGLFGDGPGQIPLGATITSAMLTVNVTNSSSAGATIYRMTADWAATSSWSSLGDGVQVGTETQAAPDLVLGSTGSATPDSPATCHSGRARSFCSSR